MGVKLKIELIIEKIMNEQKLGYAKKVRKLLEILDFVKDPRQR